MAEFLENYNGKDNWQCR